VHECVGANAWIPRVLNALYGGPSGLNREADFERTAQLAEQFLAEQSAALTVTLSEGTGASIVAHVRVTNLTGHKLPTGYGEGRRMWLNVQARDGTGQLLWESGGYDNPTGTLAADAQLHVYEVLHGIWNPTSSQCEVSDASGHAQFHFASNNCIRKDNRIPPAGFRGASDPETQPVAYAYPETSAGSGYLVNYDEVDYTVALPPATQGTVTVTAVLRHQIASGDYVEFLRDEAVRASLPSENDLCAASRAPLSTGPRQQTRGGFMYDLWSSFGRSPPTTLAVASGIIVVN
jgi:hypothetical protein